MVNLPGAIELLDELRHTKRLTEIVRDFVGALGRLRDAQHSTEHTTTAGAEIEFAIFANVFRALIRKVVTLLAAICALIIGRELHRLLPAIIND